MRRFGIRVDKQAFNFAAAHFLLFPDGTREELHGHNYAVAVEVDGELMDGEVVIDFLVFKPIVKAACDELDHRTILPTRARALDVTVEGDEVHARHAGDRFVFPKRDVILLDVANTSVEELSNLLAERILERTRERIPGARVTRLAVSVQETPGQAAWCELRPTPESVPAAPLTATRRPRD